MSSPTCLQDRDVFPIVAQEGLHPQLDRLHRSVGDVWHDQRDSGRKEPVFQVVRCGRGGCGQSTTKKKHNLMSELNLGLFIPFNNQFVTS
jgi:hypothetical protein